MLIIHSFLSLVQTKVENRLIFFNFLLYKSNSRSCTGKTQGKFKKYLGKKNSSKYSRWVRAISRRNRIKSLIRQKQLLEIQLKKLEAPQKVSEGRLTPVNGKNEYSELLKQDFAHLQKKIDSLETQINHDKPSIPICSQCNERRKLINVMRG